MQNLPRVKVPVINDRHVSAVNTLLDVSNSGVPYKLVGGFSMYLLQNVFPTPNIIERTTEDIDIALSIEVASSGQIHPYMISKGYVPCYGNKYEQGAKNLDILVSSPTQLGLELVQAAGREYPGSTAIKHALETPGYPVIADFVSQNGTVSIPVELASVEAVMVMKISALTGRKKTSDIIDIFNLLQIIESYGSHVGSWSFKSAVKSPVVLECQTYMNKIKNNKSFMMHLSRHYEVSPRYFGYLVEKWLGA